MEHFLMTTPAQRQQPTNAASIDPVTQVGLISLAVASLDRSVAYYTDSLGFTLLQRDAPHATLGVAGAPLLLLTEEPAARPFPHDQYGYTGLYHFAILVPTRADLGRWLRHWLELGNQLPGQGDHLVSEALYLTDPDGNGIEVYRDRPRSEWHWENGQVRMAADPVDIRGLLDEAARTTEPWSGLAAGTRLGHMHLQVGAIPEAAAFYHDVLGFDIVAAMPSALFVSAGGYHHHIGMNTWHSRGASAAPDGIAGLRFFSLELASQRALDDIVTRVTAAGLAVTRTDSPTVVAIQDPWRNTILLRVGAAPDSNAAAALRTAVVRNSYRAG
jgi:catechol 2,3-dioxygenase